VVHARVRAAKKVTVVIRSLFVDGMDMIGTSALRPCVSVIDRRAVGGAALFVAHFDRHASFSLGFERCDGLKMPCAASWVKIRVITGRSGVNARIRSFPRLDLGRSLLDQPSLE
jgi:hypothetical protein